MEQVLNQLPKGWINVQVKDVTKSLSSGFACNKSFETTDGYVHLRTHNISTSGCLNFDQMIKVSHEKIDEKKSKIFKGEILFNNTNSKELVGKTAYVDQDYDFAFSNHLTRIVPNDKVHSKFLVYWLVSLQTSGYFNQICKKWIGQAGVNNTVLKGLSVPLPSKEEQKRIVEKLDALLTRIDTAIEHLQQSVTLADALFESSQSEIFNDVLSNYQHSTIDEICIVTSSKRIFKADYVESGIPFYRTKEIVDLSKGKNISTELFIDKEKFSEICGKFGAPKKGDLLFSAVGTIGVMWIVDEREFYFKDGNLLWLKDMNGVTPEYLKSAISAVLTEKIKDRSQGAAYKAISITNLKAFEIPLPSIEEQKSIVARIEHVSSVTKKTKQELSLQINDLHKLKASILDSAFKGEL